MLYPMENRRSPMTGARGTIAPTAGRGATRRIVSWMVPECEETLTSHRDAPFTTRDRGAAARSRQHLGFTKGESVKILYGVQCTGNGHLSRSREIITKLKELGHEIHVIFSGRDPSDLRETGIFRPFTAYRGLTYVTRRGRIDYLATAANIDMAGFRQAIVSHDTAGFDLAITDFEPITSRVARRAGMPVIAIGHQYSFSHDIPMVRGNAVGRAVLRHFAPGDITLPLHWHHFGHPILPPVIPSTLERGKTSDRRILVYLPFENRADVEALLARIRTRDFLIYGLSDVALDDRQLHWRPFSREGFLADLQNCAGVICNAGFELPSEALFLGKRLLVKPLGRQMEQESNALALEKLGLGRSMTELDGLAVREWLNDDAPAPVLDFADVAGAVASWIHSGNFYDVGALMRSCWGEDAPSWTTRPSPDRVMQAA
jgi:uncharacterized protein (TIGR00661 family)